MQLPPLCILKDRQLCLHKYLKYWVPGAHLAEGSRGSGSLPFFDTVQTVPSNSSTNLEETPWKLSLKNERIHQNDVPTVFSSKQCTNSILFQRYFKKDTKAWLSPVRLIYSHSLLHNITSTAKVWTLIFYRTENNLLNFCVIISEKKRKPFAFNLMRLFYFKEKPTTSLRDEW